MTAEEIRNTDICASVDDRFDEGRPEFWLREIAAQLAELNKRLEAGGESFNVSVVETPTLHIDGHVHPHKVDLTIRG